MSSVVEEKFDDVEVSAFRRDVKRRRVSEFVPRRNDEVFVELHQLLDHRHRPAAGGDVGTGAPVFRGNGNLEIKILKVDFYNNHNL